MKTKKCKVEAKPNAQAKGRTMIKVKARFTNGALRPLEPVELKEGDEVTLSVDDALQL